MNSIVAIVVIAATARALPQRAASDTCDSICGVGVSGCLWEVDGERHCYKDWNNEVCKRSNTYNNAGGEYSYCNGLDVLIGTGTELCSTGLRKTVEVAVCCDKSCGECGGSGCSERSGGQDKCCTSNIKDNNVTCSAPTDTGCVMPHDEYNDLKEITLDVDLDRGFRGHIHIKTNDRDRVHDFSNFDYECDEKSSRILLSKEAIDELELGSVRYSNFMIVVPKCEHRVYRGYDYIPGEMSMKYDQVHIYLYNIYIYIYVCVYVCLVWFGLVWF